MNVKKDTIFNLLLVLIPVVILLVAVAPRILNKNNEAKQKTASLQINTITTAVEQYFKENGKYPTTEEGLHLLTTKKDKNGNPYLNYLPNDPWGLPYLYLCPGANNKKYDLWSDGTVK